MEQLTITGSDESGLVLSDGSGRRFSLAIDDALRSEVRRSGRERPPAKPLTASPKEIQSHIRAGMSAADVAELLDADVDDVRRFEGPVLAEREHIVNRALAVPVIMGTELDVDENPTFGVAIRSKLAELKAGGERWTSWKDQSGWTIKLEFTAAEVDHDARWSFEPRRNALSPLNSDATQLSRQGPLPEGLIPRLRALDTPQAKDDSRFDPAEVGPRAMPAPASADDVSSQETTPDSVREAATKRAPEKSSTPPETADLLEALRRRRGQREPAPRSELDESAARHPAGSATPVALFDALGDSGEAKNDDTRDGEGSDDRLVPAGEAPRRRGGRASMPSWDEIVFGARGDDPA